MYGWSPGVRSTVVAGVIAGMLTMASGAGAATFSVSDPTDAALQSPTDTSCVSTDGGQCTLRAAIQAADNLGGASSISLGAGTFKLTIAAVATGNHNDDPATGDLDIDQLNGAGSVPAITIAGAGTEATTIDGNGVDRLFAVHTPAATPSSLSISDITVKGGSQPGSGASANSASPGYGGAIDSSGILAINHSILTANSSGQQGGAIYQGGSGSLTITNSTLQGNTSTVAGGGLVSAATAAVTLVNDTFDGNYAGAGGGIVYFTQPTPGSKMEHVTIAHNSAGNGGGIYGPSYAVTIENTIVASNPGAAAANCYDPNALGSTDQAGAANAGGNVDSDGTCFAPSTTRDLTSVDPKLASLDDNGGPTPTDALLAGSPAIFHALGSACAPADQRGVPRLSSFCDPGAYQTLDADLALSGSGPDSARTNQPFADTFTLTNGGPYTAADVTFTNPTLPGTTATVVASQGSCSGTDTVLCSLGALTSAASATVTVTLTPAQPGTVTNVASASTSAIDPASANDSATVTTGVVAGHPPINTALPTISGIVAVNAELTADPGSWSNSPTSFAYRWQSCDQDGEGCDDIPGATGSTYTPDSGDLHRTIRVRVTALNEDGSATATSAPTEPIVNEAIRVTVGTAHTDGATVLVPAECVSGNAAVIAVCELLFVLTAQSGNSGAQHAANSAAHHAKPVVVGKLKAKLRVGKRKTVRISLNRTGRRLLAKKHTLKVKLTVSQNGKTVRTKTVTFKMKAKKKHH